MTPTKEQLAFFDTFGFIRFTGAFRDDADRIIEAFEGVWTSHGGGHNEEAHDHKRSLGHPPLHRPETST